MLNRQHSLFVLADKIDWTVFDKEFGSLYVEKVGRPALPIRLLVGLHYLKHAFNVSDEYVVVQFVENPYWQYFCGFEYFQHRLPLDPTTLVKWRKRIGPEGMEKLLAETLDNRQAARAVDRATHGAGQRRYHGAGEGDCLPDRCPAVLQGPSAPGAPGQAAPDRAASDVRACRQAGLHQADRYSHARQMNRARRELKRLRTQLGCVIRDIWRKCPHPDQALATMLARAERIYRQQRHDSNKLYSLHAPEVECIAKGKAHKKYEFGCKVSLVSTSKDNWIVGMQALHGNPFDGHTLKDAVEQSERLTGWRAGACLLRPGLQGGTEAPG